MKFISHVLLLVVGFGLGVWWGVNHPTQAAKMAQNEQRVVNKAEQTVKTEVNKSNTVSPAAAPAGSNSGH